MRTQCPCWQLCVRAAVVSHFLKYVEMLLNFVPPSSKYQLPLLIRPCSRQHLLPRRTLLPIPTQYFTLFIHPTMTHQHSRHTIYYIINKITNGECRDALSIKSHYLLNSDAFFVLFFLSSRRYRCVCVLGRSCCRGFRGTRPTRCYTAIEGQNGASTALSPPNL